MNRGLILGILGSVIGLAGGIIGSYLSIKNTNGPKEKVFVKKAVLGFWIGIIVFLIFLLIIPVPYNNIMWIVYGILLPITIIYFNKRQEKIRKEEKDINKV